MGSGTARVWKGHCFLVTDWESKDTPRSVSLLAGEISGQREEADSSRKAAEPKLLQTVKTKSKEVELQSQPIGKSCQGQRCQGGDRTGRVSLPRARWRCCSQKACMQGTAGHCCDNPCEGRRNRELESQSNMGHSKGSKSRLGGIRRFFHLRASFHCVLN